MERNHIDVVCEPANNISSYLRIHNGEKTYHYLICDKYVVFTSLDLFWHCRGDGTCKHVIALLFGVVDMADQVYVAPTEQACVWTRPGVSSSSVLVRDIQPSASEDDAADVTSYASVQLRVSPDELRRRLGILLEGTNSLMLTTLDPPEPAADPSQVAPPSPLPTSTPTLMQLAPECASAQELISKLQTIYTTDVCEAIRSKSMAQSESPVWQQYRKGRLTASLFYQAGAYKGGDIFNSVTKSVLQLYGNFSTEATRYGLAAEKPARDIYKQRHIEFHPDVSVLETGLHISPDYPYLGASPDGLIQCSTCGFGVIEIKSPFKYRNATWQEAAQDTANGCSIEGNSLRVKRHSRWMYQIQGQMMITGASYCDFVLNAQTMMATRISRDEVLISQLRDDLRHFFVRFIFPALKEMNQS